MLAVFVLLILFMFILKRLRGGALSLKKYPVMKIISTISLAPKRSLAIIEIENEWLLLGVGTESISILSKYNKPEETGKNSLSPLPGVGRFTSFLSRAGITGKSSEESSRKDEKQ